MSDELPHLQILLSKNPSTRSILLHFWWHELTPCLLCETHEQNQVDRLIFFGIFANLTL